MIKKNAYIKLISTELLLTKHIIESYYRENWEKSLGLLKTKFEHRRLNVGYVVRGYKPYTFQTYTNKQSPKFSDIFKQQIEHNFSHSTNKQIKRKQQQNGNDSFGYKRHVVYQHQISA